MVEEVISEFLLSISLSLLPFPSFRPVPKERPNCLLAASKQMRDKDNMAEGATRFRGPIQLEKIPLENPYESQI